MTSDLVLNLARAHLAASLLILLVLAVRRPVRILVGPRVAYALWLLPLIAAFAVLTPRVRYETALASAPAQASEIQSIIAPFQSPVFDQAPAALAIDPWQAILVLWVFGIAASLTWLMVQQIRYLAFARRGAAGPAVVGFWLPKVVLPVDFEERYSTQEQGLILAHETTHLRRQDPRVIGLALILRSLAWFNPLAYIAVTKLRIDQELACDETVVSHFPKARRAYADALAKSQLAIRPLPLGCYWPSGTEHPLLERLSMLKASRIGAQSRLAGASALALLCAATGLAAWAATPPQVRYLPAAPSPPVASLPPSAPVPAGPTLAPTAQLALLQPAAAPAAPAAPLTAAPLPPGMQAQVNTDRPIAFSGTLEKMEWVNPSSVITYRDANGESHRVMTDSPSTLMRGGADRNFMTIGSEIIGVGYASKDGAMLFAPPTTIYVNNKKMHSDPAAYAREQELRNTLCGQAPALPPGATPDDLRASNTWRTECEAKVVAGLAGGPSGPPPAAAFSITTNSVIRQGAQ